jgi:hypothetical protein
MEMKLLRRILFLHRLYMFHQNIRLPGVYIFNNTSGGEGMQSAPIFCTMSILSIIGANDASEKVLVFPKFKVIFYLNSGFNGTNLTVDNTNGTKCKYVAGLNEATSCRVYYDNVEIPEIFSTTGT